MEKVVFSKRSKLIATGTLLGGVLVSQFDGGEASAPQSSDTPASICMSSAAISEQFAGDRTHPMSTGVAADLSQLPLETGKIPRYQTENGTWHEGRFIPPFSEYVFNGRKPVPRTEAEKITAYNSVVHAIGEGATRFAIVLVATTDQTSPDGYHLCDQKPDVSFSGPQSLAELKRSGIEPDYSTKVN